MNFRRSRFDVKTNVNSRKWTICYLPGRLYKIVQACMNNATVMQYRGCCQRDKTNLQGNIKCGIIVFSQRHHRDRSCFQSPGLLHWSNNYINIPHDLVFSIIFPVLLVTCSPTALVHRLLINRWLNFAFMKLTYLKVFFLIGALFFFANHSSTAQFPNQLGWINHNWLCTIPYPGWFPQTRERKPHLVHH